MSAIICEEAALAAVQLALTGGVNGDPSDRWLG